MSQTKPTRIKPKRKPRRGCCCAIFSTPVFLILILLVVVFLLTPGRINILILGIDSRDSSNLGRSDTIILTTFVPSEPYVGMLSIPRDLWVNIPGFGENRINTAHFFGEADLPDNGPLVSLDTIKNNFGVDVDYYLRIQHAGFLDLIDSLGGIDIYFPRPMSGFDQGLQHLTGEQALALVRDRQGSDDFSRMQRGQIFLDALLKQWLRSVSNPAKWSMIPDAVKYFSQSLDTNVPFWRWPSLILTALRVGSDGIDARIIDREMVVPFVTSGGAAVLSPVWEKINPVLMEMFNQ